MSPEFEEEITLTEKTASISYEISQFFRHTYGDDFMKQALSLPESNDFKETISNLTQKIIELGMFVDEGDSYTEVLFNHIQVLIAGLDIFNGADKEKMIYKLDVVTELDLAYYSAVAEANISQNFSEEEHTKVRQYSIGVRIISKALLLGVRSLKE